MTTFDKLSTSLLDTLIEEMKRALKAGEKARLSTVRMLISAIKYAQVDNIDLDEAGMMEVLGKEAKKRRESVEAYRSAGHEERARSEEAELAVIGEYLPKMMDEEEVRKRVMELLSGGSIDNVGLAIGRVMKELKGKADGKLVAKIVNEVMDGNR